MVNSLESKHASVAGKARFDTMTVLSLAAIGIVVVLISVPSLEHFAKRQNERDALLVLRILGRAHTTTVRQGNSRDLSRLQNQDASTQLHSATQVQLIEAGFGEQSAPDREPVYAPGELGTLLHLRPEILHRLPDMEVLEDGRQLRAHGYLFQWQGSPATQDQLRDNDFVMLAWPWEWGRTGGAAFALDGAGRQFRNENDVQRWSGPEALPQSPPAEGWVPLR